MSCLRSSGHKSESVGFQRASGRGSRLYCGNSQRDQPHERGWGSNFGNSAQNQHCQKDNQNDRNQQKLGQRLREMQNILSWCCISWLHLRWAMLYAICAMAVRRRVLASSHHTTHRRVECVWNRCVQTWDLSSKSRWMHSVESILKICAVGCKQHGLTPLHIFLKPWSLFVIIYDHPWFSTSEFARQSWCLAGETPASDAAETRRPNRSPWCGG